MIDLIFEKAATITNLYDVVLLYQLVTNKSHPRVGLAELRSNMRAPDRMIIASNLPLWPFVGHFLISFNLQSGLNSV